MTPAVWTPDEVRLVMSMVDEGRTLGQIACALDRSRGSVAGLVWRQKRHRKAGTVRPDFMPARKIPMRFSDIGKDFSA